VVVCKAALWHHAHEQGTDQVGQHIKREALCACLNPRNPRFLVKNISIVSNFAQTGGAGSHSIDVGPGGLSCVIF
jgi:hypothetical protein